MNINLIAFIAAGLMPMIMGFIYYHPKVMGTMWMDANGLTNESIGKGPKPVMYLLSTVMSFLLAFFFWGWVTGAGATSGSQWAEGEHNFVSFKHGAFHGLAFMIMVLAPIFITNAIFEKRSFRWAFVNIGYWGLCAIIMNGILSAWR